MELKDELINLYKETVCINRNILILAKKQKRYRSQQKKLNGMFIALGLMGVAYVTIAEIKREDQNDTISRLSKEIAELKKQKGE